MFIDIVPNGRSEPAVLLRESYREDGKVKKRTIANLGALPAKVIDGLRLLLAGGAIVGDPHQAFEIQRALPHGHVAATMAMMRKLDLVRLLDRTSSRERDLATALIVSRIIAAGSKLATLRGLSEETASSSLGRILSLEAIETPEIYGALDWLGERQERIERALARRHLKDGVLVLYDVSSSYFEGRCCRLAQHGYSRDHRGDRLQIVYGLLCDREGRPIAVQVFDGDMADPKTLPAQVETLKRRFSLSHVVLVGDRGMITSARVREDLKPAGFDWITCLRAGQVQALAAGGELQMSFFDERDLVEITTPDFPGERLIACRNPDLARQRGRKREDLLAATERDLSQVARMVARKRQPLRGEAEIGLAIGKVIDRHKMAKHFELTVTDHSFAYRRNEEAIAREAFLDGVYVIRTSLPADAMNASDAVRAYKDLARVEWAFRTLKSDDLQIRPIRHWTEKRVRAHVFLCMLAYYIEWHLTQAWAPILFCDHDRAAAEAQRSSPVAAAIASPAAKAKKASLRTDDGTPVTSFADLMAHLATMTLNVVAAPRAPALTFKTCSKPTPLQTRAFDLLGAELPRVQ
jgi:hypothetical protein